MTKLEKLIYNAIAAETEGSNIDTRLAEVAAAAVLPLIEDAFDAGGDRATFHGRPGIEDALTKSEWIEVNITKETE